MPDLVLTRKLSEGVEHVLESLTQGLRSEAKYALARLIEYLGGHARVHDPLYWDVLHDLRKSSDLLMGATSEGGEALRLLWGTQKRLRSR